MDLIRRSEFLKKFAEGEHTDAEHLEFMEWVKLASSSELEQMMDLSEKYDIHDLIAEGPSGPFIQSLEMRLDQLDQKPAMRVKTWKTWYAVAAILALLTLASALFFYQNRLSEDSRIVMDHDLEPGSNKAYLTLANGKRIALSDAANGTLGEEAGIKVSKTADGAVIYEANRVSSADKHIIYNTIETPKGGQYQVHLPDGTKVWLNAASTLKYPVSFASAKERRVELSGEAYFEVAKDKAHPFHVQSVAQDIEVLGTHFNVNGYAGTEHTTTTLLEGAVSVHSLLRDKAGAVLKPGQQSELSNSGIQVADVNTDIAMAWQKGLFSFNNADLKTILAEFSRWYNIEVVYEGKIPDQKFTGEISRKITASQFLKILKIFKVKFTMEGNGTAKRIKVSAA